MNSVPFLIIGVVVLMLACGMGVRSVRGWIAALLTGAGALAVTALSILYLVLNFMALGGEME